MGPIVLLRGHTFVGKLRQAADACLGASDMAVLTALLNFDCTMDDLLAPIRGLEALIEDALGGPFTCVIEQCWVRRKFPPSRSPRSHYPQGWHQDGGLGVKFPLAPGAMPEMTPLVTCWIPLDPCDRTRPGLELISHPLDELLHFTELDDALLRRRFAPEEFQAPMMEAGDALLFRNSIIHRTWLQPEMWNDRLSVDYRFFPANRA